MWTCIHTCVNARPAHLFKHRRLGCIFPNRLPFLYEVFISYTHLSSLSLLFAELFNYPHYKRLLWIIANMSSLFHYDASVTKKCIRSVHNQYTPPSCTVNHYLSPPSYLLWTFTTNLTGNLLIASRERPLS